MILAKDAILKAIKSGDIKIEPFCKECIGAGSVDLHLGNVFRVFTKYSNPIDAVEEVDSRNISKLAELKEGGKLELKSMETVLGITREQITLAPDIAGWLEGRSRFARIGLGVHITSGFVQPGVANHQVLEITNLSPNSINLIPGVRVCQIVFEKCEGKARYEGQFDAQKTP